MKFRKATEKYEAWLGQHLTMLEADLKLKHDAMRAGKFPFLRATYYRWAQILPEVCGKLNSAAKVLGVGDLHVENFGTWRDVEGRLIWGINDFDEAYPLPYTHDLVRLAASANMAIDENHLKLDPRQAAEAILEGYIEMMKNGGRPFVLAEKHLALREMAVHRLKDPALFWEKLEKLATARQSGFRAAPSAPSKACFRNAAIRVQGGASHRRPGQPGTRALRGDRRMARRQSGARSQGAGAIRLCLGQRRHGSVRIQYQRILDCAIRCRDPFVMLKGRWIVRRLAPDCSRIEMASLPECRDELRLLRAMGAETANVHLGTAKAKVILKDLQKRGTDWLHQAAHQMIDAVVEDWEEWRKG